MRTFKSLFLVLAALVTFSSCSTDKTMIADGVNLKKYEYASIVQMSNSIGTLTDIEIEPGIYDALEATRLQMVGERRIEDLTPEQKGRLVLVKCSATSNEEKSTLSVSFEDYMTGKVVASCRASNRGAWTRQRDVNRAIRKLSNRISQIWR